MPQVTAPRLRMLPPPAEHRTRNHSRNQPFLLATIDDVLLHIVEEAVAVLGSEVASVRTGGDVLARAHLVSLRLAMLDHDLADVAALDVARALHHEAPALPFLLIGQHLNIAITVQAMKLGAITVLEKPVTVTEILAAVRSAGSAPQSTPRRAEAPRHAARSTAERWAMHVLKACEADGDLKTLGAWAAFAGLSPSSLCEICRLVGIQPLLARDLTRILSAVLRSCRNGSRIDQLLDISDRRTLRRLMRRAGLSADPDRRAISVEQFLAAQQFVPSNNPGFASLRALLLQ